MTRKIIKFNNLKSTLKDEFNRQYPFGFKDAVIEINKSADKETLYAVPLEIDDTYYLVVVDNKIQKPRKKSRSYDYDDDEEYSDDYFEGNSELYSGADQSDDDDDSSSAYSY